MLNGDHVWNNFLKKQVKKYNYNNRDDKRKSKAKVAAANQKRRGEQL